MDIFEFDDYKKFVNDRIKALPKRGFGTYRKLALHLRINSVMVSQIFKGDRHLSPEQALGVGEFFGLNELSTDYLILLVQISRAGTKAFENRLKKRLNEIKQKSKHLGTRLPKDAELREKDKVVFYSHWYFSALRLATSIDQFQSATELSEHFQLPLGLVNQALEFLVEKGLCVRDGGRIQMGPQRTHLNSESALLPRHHLNWRIKGMAKIDRIESDELFYTGPMALSHEAMGEIRKDLVRLIEQATEKVVDSKSETLACLNLDWFRF